MEIFLLAIVILVLILVLAMVSMILYATIRLLPISSEDLPEPKTQTEGKDFYTPQETEGTVPLDQFNPNFRKPLKIVIKDEDGQTITEEVDDNG